jgi:WD40 repeat protein/tRNA A-37 threonylcarbamoyl transferase component Bud32
MDQLLSATMLEPGLKGAIARHPMNADPTCARCGGNLDAQGLCPSCELSLALEPALPATQPSAVGLEAPLKSFGDYDLIEEIARGGMGIVYKARQKSLNRLVAIKTLAAGSEASKEFVLRFRTEAAAAGMLDHPNIVAIHEVGMHDGQHFFSMDYVDGPNLSTFARGQPLPAARAARYLKLIAQAVHYAHGKGIFHRDLKPSNVLIDSNDQPRVTDFGLAKRADSQTELTLTGQLLGSPNYMPPEQADHTRGKTGVHSDIYSLGAILYHLLTGRPPFLGETLTTVIHQLLHTEPAPPRLLNPSVPRDLETICLKCLEKEPLRRYPSAQVVADELDRFLADTPIRARPVSPPEKVWRWCRRKPVLATLGALVLALLLVVLFGTPMALVRINSARVEAEWKAYAADMRLASDALRNGEMAQVQELLKSHEPTRGGKDSRGFEWRYLKRAADQSGLVSHQLQGLARGAESHFYSDLATPGGILYNFLVGTDQIRAWDMKTLAQLPMKLPSQRASEWWWRPWQQAAMALDEQRRTISIYRLPDFDGVGVIQVPGRASQAALAKDLRTLAAGFQDGDVHRVLVWDLAAGSQRWIQGGYRGRVNCLGFSPDGTVLVVACDDGQVELWSIAQGKVLLSPARDASSVQQDWRQPPFFGPNSTRLYLNRGRVRSAVEVWDWTIGKLWTVYQSPLGQLRACCFSPDGAILATAWSDGTIALQDTKESRPLGVMNANGAAIISLAFSPSGKFIASGGEDSSARLWDVKTQRELQVLGGHEDKVTGVAFTADKKSLLTLAGNGAIKVWPLQAVRGRDVLWRTTNVIEAFRVAADQRAVATSDNSGELRVWDLGSGAQLRSIPTPEPNGIAADLDFAFSPTEHLVAWTGWSAFGVMNYDSGQSDTFPLSRSFGFCNPAFSLDGREFAVAGDTNILICDTATRQLRPFATVEQLVYGLAFSPNGVLLATAHEGGSLSLWERATGRELTREPDAHPPTAFEVVFSPDGRLLASSGLGGTAKLWVVTSGGLKLRHILRGHVGSPDLALVFSPDCRRIVSSSSADNVLGLWDTETGLEVGRIYNPPGRFAGFAFSRDGNTIYSATRAGEVRVWRAPPLEQFESPIMAKKVRQ